MSTRAFTVTTLGTGAALPARGRFPSAQLVNVHQALYLIDCGEGTQERLRMAGVNFLRIGHVFISHLHGDHYLGLMGLLSSMHLMGRQTPLVVYGPPDLWPIIDIQLKASGTYLRYPLHVRPWVHESGVMLHQDSRVSVHGLALRHRIDCTGFLFRETPAPRTLRRETVVRIPHFKRNAVKAGEDLVLPDGQVVPNAELTLDPPPPRTYAYCSDTAYEPALVPYLRDVDLLYHEATFTEALAAKARETHHSTAAQAARLALEAGVKRLLLGHFSSRYRSADELLQEAARVFPRVEASEDGRTYFVHERTAV